MKCFIILFYIKNKTFKIYCNFISNYLRLNYCADQIDSFLFEKISIIFKLQINCLKVKKHALIMSNIFSF